MYEQRKSAGINCKTAKCERHDDLAMLKYEKKIYTSLKLMKCDRILVNSY